MFWRHSPLVPSPGSTERENFNKEYKLLLIIPLLVSYLKFSVMHTTLVCLEQTPRIGFKGYEDKYMRQQGIWPSLLSNDRLTVFP